MKPVKINIEDDRFTKLRSERRCRRLIVSVETFKQMLGIGIRDDDRYRVSVKGIPADALIGPIHFDERYDAFAIMLLHEEFSPIDACLEIPALVAQYTVHYDQ